MPAAQPSQARIKSALAAAKAEGLVVEAFVIERDGALRIIAKPTEARHHVAREVVDCDDIFRVKVSG
jgi:hypothetical protein